MMLHSHKARDQRARNPAERSLILLWCALSLIAPCAGAQNPPRAQADAESGISLAREGKWAEAENKLIRAIREAPSVALYHAQLGSILGLEGKWRESLTSFRKAVELEPSSIVFRRETAAVEWQLGLTDAAEKNIRFVLKQKPSDAGATLLLGLVSDTRGDYAGAARLLLSQFDLAVSQPDRAVVLFHSLWRSGQKGEIGRVIDVFRSHLGDPLWASAISRCTVMAATADNLETAETLFALTSDDGDSEQRVAGLALAGLLYRTAHLSQAQELLLRLIQRGWVSADAQTLLGHCLEAQQQRAQALEAYSKALELDSSTIVRYEDLISLELESGRTNDALALAKRAVVVAPQNAGVWILKGNAEVRTNAYKDALASYIQAGRLDGTNPDTMLLIAGMHFIIGENDAAVAEYESGMERFASDPRFYVNCAEVLLGSPDSAGLHVRVRELLQKAIKLAPQSAEAHYQSGQLALREGQLQAAENEFSASLQLEPNLSKMHYAMSVVYRRMGRASDAEKQFAIYKDLKRAEESGMGEGAGEHQIVPENVPGKPYN